MSIFTATVILVLIIACIVAIIVKLLGRVECYREFTIAFGIVLSMVLTVAMIIKVRSGPVVDVNFTDYQFASTVSESCTVFEEDNIKKISIDYLDENDAIKTATHKLKSIKFTVAGLTDDSYRKVTTTTEWLGIQADHYSYELHLYPDIIDSLIS